MTTFDAAERDWAALPADARCAVWRWADALGWERRRVTLVLCHDGRLLAGVHVAMPIKGAR